MIKLKINDKSMGWLHMTINNHHFCVSYLNDFINDMARLLVFKNDPYETEIHREYFDGEGVDLYLNAWKSYKTLFIVWEYYGENDNPEIELMQFDYDEFVKEFEHEFMIINNKYWIQFDLDSINKMEENEDK